VWQVQTKNSSLFFQMLWDCCAILSLAFACGNGFIPIIGAIGGIILGHLALRQIRRDRYLEGRNLAKWGLWIGYVGLTLQICGLFIIFHMLDNMKIYQ
jgi:hypothetical protein